MSYRKLYSDVDPSLGHEISTVAPDELQWISTSAPPQETRGDRKAQKVIKSHVMRRHRYREKNQAESSNEVERRSEAVRTAGDSSRSINVVIFPLHSPGNAHQQLDHVPTKQPSPIDTSVDSGSSDPFDSLALGCDPAHFVLLNNYVNNFYENSVPINPTAKWLKYALSDEVFMHAILASSALHYMLTTENKAFARIQSLSHEVLAQQRINESMADPIRCYRDEVIAGICYLALIALVQSRFLECDMHFSAIVRMVKHRGGVKEMGMEGMLTKFLIWVDRLYTASTGSRSGFTDLHISEFSNVETLPSLPMIIQQIRHVSLMLGSWGTCSEVDKEIAIKSYSEDLSELENKLVLLLLEVNDDQAFYIAAYIYANQMLRMIPLPMGLWAKQLRILKDALLQSNRNLRSKQKDNGNCIKRENRFLWTLFVAATFTEDGSDRDWFVQELAKSCDERELRSWEAVKQCLQEVVWNERLCEHIWKEQWRESQGMTNEAGLSWSLLYGGKEASANEDPTTS